MKGKYRSTEIVPPNSLIADLLNKDFTNSLKDLQSNKGIMWRKSWKQYTNRVETFKKKRERKKQKKNPKRKSAIGMRSLLEEFKDRF